MNRILNRLFVGGSLASSCFSKDKEAHTRLTKEERIQAKKVLARIGKLEQAFKDAVPVVVIGLVGWSVIWLYRGLKWQSCRGKMSLQCYVDKTYNMARVFGISTFLAGTGTTLSVIKTEKKKETKEEEKPKGKK